MRTAAGSPPGVPPSSKLTASGVSMWRSVPIDGRKPFSGFSA
jgi:hypothetical protein